MAPATLSPKPDATPAPAPASALAPSPSPSETAELERLAGTLAGLRAAVRQRQGEAATVRSGASELQGLLLDLQRHEFVEEPVPVSPRPVVGRLLVFLRKAVYHLFFKWHARAVLAQQNAFNQSAARLIQELAERERRTDEELRRLRREVEAVRPPLAPRLSDPDSSPRP